MSTRFSLENRTGYDSGDLSRFFARGFRAMGISRSQPILIVVSAAPQRSRGCAEIQGDVMSIALGAPSHFSLRRLARLFEHESAHIMGMDHEDMPHKLLYSLGPTPRWARGSQIRYKSRAPDQLQFLRSHKSSRR